MILSYGLRLVCLSLAVLAMVYGLVGFAVAAAGPVVVRVTDGLRPRNGARLLLALRLLPAFSAIFVVGAFFVPSYLWLEQEAGGEEIGWLCVSAGMAAVVFLSYSACNLVQALVRSSRYARHCEHSGAPVLMLAGIVRPRLVVSNVVRRVLSAEQLDAALRHEHAHRLAYDNFKRLLMAATPRMPGFAVLERGWSRASEWAADDDAVAGDARRALCLADALVRVARLGAVAVEVSFLGDGRDLAQRVDRLLNPQSYAPSRPHALAAAAGGLGVITFVAIATLAQSLQTAHNLFEHLAH
jgi:hypothetical protein